MKDMRERDRLMSELVRQQIETFREAGGKITDNLATEFVQAAADGRYQDSPPVGPYAIGMTRDEFLAMMAVAYA